MRTSLVLCVLGALALAGCKSSTSPGAAPVLVMPNAGSYFITLNTTTDSTGKVISQDTSKDIIIQTNATIYGKSGVYVSLDSGINGWSTDTGYGKYESNGDVSSYGTSSGNSSSQFPSGWFTLPFASQTSSLWFNLVVSFDVNKSSRLIATLSGNGSGTVNIKGQSFQTENAKITIVETDTTLATGSVYTINNDIYFSFAPSLGYGVETDQPGIREYAGAPLDPSTHSQLIDYYLK